MGNYNSTFTMNLPLNTYINKWTPTMTENFNKSVKKTMFKGVFLTHMAFMILTPSGLILQSKEFGAEPIMIDYKNIVRLRGDNTNFHILTNDNEYALTQTDSKEIIRHIKMACLFIRREA